LKERSLKLFIGNIPGEALLVDIYDFLGGLQLQAEFQAQQGKDCHRNSYHYVIAELSGVTDVETVIKEYDGMDFQGNSLCVRQYQDRLPCPDTWCGNNKRVNLH